MLQAYQNIVHQDKKIEKILKSFFLLHPQNVDLSLNRIKRLLHSLKNPHKNIENIIHIAGTNGKGSIATILFNLQKIQGKTVNVYRSPHLISFNERFFIRNKKISNKYLFEVLEFIKEVNEGLPITFFEIITAAAFYMFYENRADLTILEVGLGGRCDATNIIDKSLISIISTIDIDHKEFLGNNIKAIAKEKVGIIKRNSCVISSIQKLAAKKIIHEKAHTMGSQLNECNVDWKVKNKIFYYKDIEINLSRLSLLGKHQYINASCALMACVKKKILNIDFNTIDKSLSMIKWSGRIEKIKSHASSSYKDLEIWADVAHNKLGFKVLIDWVKESNLNNLYIILALGIKKSYLNVLKEINKTNPKVIYLVSMTNFQNHNPYKIQKAATKYGIKTLVCDTAFNALDDIKKNNQSKLERKRIIITGSIGLVGSFLSEMK
ncbi:MAG: hypothetical protein CMP36_02110 [Rickettsiales bacterium]|nr:hypothetical protein [Rickettsiales bacterium]OUV80974.1 MAG: hypothetical protein CBC91_02645 [Rickettsiales bacterium TMED131]